MTRVRQTPANGLNAWADLLRAMVSQTSFRSKLNLVSGILENGPCCPPTTISSTRPKSWRREGRGVAIATVVETWGSAPRPVGSHLIIDEEGNFLGSVSGGCVEGAVVNEAVDVIGDGKPRMLEFGVADETAWRVGLSCGGRIRVLVEKVD